MKLPALPRLKQPKPGGEAKPSDGAPDSADFQKMLEMLAATSAATAEQKQNDAPKVQVKASSAQAYADYLDSEGVTDDLEAENTLDRVESTSELLKEPSLLDQYRSRLIEGYGFSSDDPVFALCEILDGALKSFLRFTAASERHCESLLQSVATLVDGFDQKSATLEQGLKELVILKSLVGALGKLVDRVETSVLETKETGAAQGAELRIVQGELEKAVHNALQKTAVERILMAIILVATLLAGLLLGAHLK